MAVSIFKYFSKDIGIDLGTANTIIYASKRGFVLNEPSVIAYQRGAVYKVGKAAKEMIGKTHNELEVVRPLADGVISDFRAGDDLIKTFIKNVGISRLLINRVVIGVPTGITPVEQNAVLESALTAGARKAYLIREPMAAAVGLGLDVFGSKAHMIVDIGGGTTDIAVINYGGIVLDNTLRIAGDEMNEALQAYLKTHFHLHIGELTAEHIKINYGALCNHVSGIDLPVRGIDHNNRLPRELLIKDSLFEKALQHVLESIVEAIKKTLDELPPELAGDLIEHGIVLTGGGALLKGLDQYLREKIGLAVSFPDNALYCVAEGTRKILEDFNTYRSLLQS